MQGDDQLDAKWKELLLSVGPKLELIWQPRFAFNGGSFDKALQDILKRYIAKQSAAGTQWVDPYKIWKSETHAYNALNLACQREFFNLVGRPRSKKEESLDDQLDDLDGGQPNGFDVASQNETIARIEEAVKTLSDKNGEVAELMLRGFSVAEAAEKLNQEPEAIYKRWQRARKELREKLAELLESPAVS